jgi:hypothetical protein
VPANTQRKDRCGPEFDVELVGSAERQMAFAFASPAATDIAGRLCIIDALCRPRSQERWVLGCLDGSLVSRLLRSNEVLELAAAFGEGDDYGVDLGTLGEYIPGVVECRARVLYKPAADRRRAREQGWTADLCAKEIGPIHLALLVAVTGGACENAVSKVVTVPRIRVVDVPISRLFSELLAAVRALSSEMAPERPQVFRRPIEDLVDSSPHEICGLRYCVFVLAAKSHAPG